MTFYLDDRRHESTPVVPSAHTSYRERARLGYWLEGTKRVVLG